MSQTLSERRAEILSLSLPVLLAAASLSSVLGGSMVYFRKRWPEQSLFALISIGGGLLLSLTVLDMLPHSIGKQNHSYMLFVLIGFILLFVIEAISKHDHQVGVTHVIGIACGFLIHSFMEGISMMASFQMDAQVGVSVVLALILHKIPDGLTLGSILLLATDSRSIAFAGTVMLGAATLLGAWVMEIVEKSFAGIGTQLVFAVATGVFLYLSASHLVPLVQQKGGGKAVLFFLAAVLSYMIMTFFFCGNGHFHV